MTNTEALDHWNGAAGLHWATEAERYDRMNRHFADRVVETAAPRPGDRVLDVGCGNGALALAVAESVAPTGRVVGLDLSRPMLDVTRARATDRGLADVVALQHGDAQTHDLADAGFDLVVSRFGVMFFTDPPAAFTNLATGLRPGGRLVFSCWQHMTVNDWVTVPAAAALEHVPVPSGLGSTAAHGAFSLADPAATVALLETSGFTDVTVRSVVAPMWMGASVDDAVSFMRTTEFANTLFTGASPTQATDGWRAVARALTDHRTSDGVELNGATWLVAASTSVSK